MDTQTKKAIDVIIDIKALLKKGNGEAMVEMAKANPAWLQKYIDYNNTQISLLLTENNMVALALAQALHKFE